jgi:hypothetical protein
LWHARDYLLQFLTWFTQEFEEAKRREIEEDAPHEVDTSLPGWVSFLRLTPAFFS